MRTYYRLQAGDYDPERLLDPDEQYTEPWGDDESVREGVSVFPEVDGLYRYMIRRDAHMDEDMVLVALEGLPSEDRDFDADEGARLVKPTRIVAVEPIDMERVEQLRGELAR
jgi:hypothetical protein